MEDRHFMSSGLSFQITTLLFVYQTKDVDQMSKTMIHKRNLRNVISLFLYSLLNEFIDALHN